METLFTITSDLLDQYKKFSTISTEKKMQAICTKDFKGFMSIGDDNTWYLTYEDPGHTALWAKVNMNDTLQKFHPNKELYVKTYSAAIDPVSSKYILMAAIVIDNKDYIYLSKSVDILNPQWQEVILKEDMRSKFSLYDLDISSYNDDLYTIATFKENDGNIERFFINSDQEAGELWRFYPLPANFDVMLQTCHGRTDKQRVGGIYTLGNIKNVCQLLYTPDYNVYNPDINPTSVRLDVPEDIDCIASLLVKGKPYTHLFGCGSGSLYLYPFDKQYDLAKPIKLISSHFFNNVKQLFVFNSQKRIYVWVLNESKQLTYVYADIDKIGERECWSDVFLIRDDLDYVYPFQNMETRTNAMFGYLTNGAVVIGEESSSTGLWAFEEVYIDSTSGKKPIPITSYTTKIVVTDENKKLIPNKRVLLKASEHCRVYINGIAYRFKDSPIEVSASQNGEIKIVQTASSPAAIQFTVQEKSGKENHFDPSEDVINRVYELDTKDKLKNAEIISQSGSKQPLLPSNIDDTSLEAVVNSINLLRNADLDIKKANAMKAGIPLSNKLEQEFEACLKSC